MKPVVDRLEQIYGGKVSFYKMEVSDPKAAALYQRLGGHHPIFLLLDPKRGYVEQLQGPQQEDKLGQLLSQMAG